MTEALSLVLATLVGGLGVFGLFVFVIAANPEKVQVWASLLWGLVRRVTKRAEYIYVASDVAGRINAHLAAHILPSVTELSAKRIQVHWDNTADAVEREAEGTLIVRLKPHHDRLVNILKAYLVAVPRLFAPTIRSQLAAAQSRAIDLQLCRRLAENLSQSAVTVYRINILDPDLKKDPTLTEILERLQTLDLGGLFVPILLQELIKLSAAYPADSLPDLATEIDQFVNFLRTVAERPSGQDVPLSFFGRRIRINVLLVARAERRAQGVGPYRTRVSLELAKGVDTFYVLATNTNLDFAKDVASALDSDRRLLRQQDRPVILDRSGTVTSGIVIPFERNAGYCASAELSKRLANGQLSVGKKCSGTVTDVQPSYVAIDIDGAQGIIPIEELSWHFVDDCTEEVDIGEVLEIEIVEVREDEHELVASRRRCLPNPFDDLDPNSLRGSKQIFVTTSRGGSSVGRRFLAGHLRALPNIPARLYETELEWGAAPHGVRHIDNGAEIEVVVHDIQQKAGFVLCSRKRLSADHWQEIREKYPKGMRLTVRASAILEEGVWCEVEPGLAGFVSGDEFRRAGLEYSHYLVNVRERQELFVIVNRVVAGEKQRLNLGLQINYPERGKTSA